MGFIFGCVSLQFIKLTFKVFTFGESKECIVCSTPDASGLFALSTVCHVLTCLQFLGLIRPVRELSNSGNHVGKLEKGNSKENKKRSTVKVDLY